MKKRDCYALTPQQQNIWNLQKFYEGTAIANQCGVALFHDDYSPEEIVDSLKQVIQNQNGIRLCFHDGAEVLQYVSDNADIDIPVLQFQDMQMLDRFAEDEARNPLCDAEKPLFRFFVFQADEKTGILAVMNHMITDAWSFSLLINSVDQLLHGKTFQRGNYIDYIDKTDQYRASERYQIDMDYWKSKYGSRPELSPVRPETDASKSIKAARIQKKFSPQIDQEIRNFCEKERITHAVLFETVLIIYLSKINQKNNCVTIGIPVLNRADKKEKHTVGMFISTMPLTVEVDGSMTVVELMHQVEKVKTEVFRHQKYPYADILRFLRSQQNFNGNLYDVMVSYQNAETIAAVSTKWYFNGYSEVPLAIHIDNRDREEQYTLTLDYQVSAFPQEKEVVYVFQRLEHIAEQICVKPDASLQDISVIPEEEKKVLLEKFNDTYADFPFDKCVHELFSEQAKKTPDKVALVFEEQSFTYKELDNMSDALAEMLEKSRRGGVRRNEVIPIIARRDWRIIVAMLGVLKAGGAYMLLSPDYPFERIVSMIKTAESEIVLCYGYKDANMLEKRLYKGGGATDKLILDMQQLKQKAGSLITFKSKSDDTCYIIFTSGSTGEPKGAVIKHRNLINFLNSNRYNSFQTAFAKDSKRILADGDVVFDLSIFEIVLSLYYGKTIVLSGDLHSPKEIGRLITRHKIDTLLSTPTKLKLWMEDESFRKAFSQITLLMCGAEAYTEDLHCRIRRCSKTEIFNGYGPTENTIACCFKNI